MGRPKGRKSGYKFWTTEEKYDLISPIINGEISSKQLAKDIGMSSNGMLIKWIHQFKIINKHIKNRIAIPTHLNTAK